jgi:molybdopterin/thiamine biosynthesis adenylyltransferase
MDFSEDQIQRYSRHFLLQDVGVEGQERIRNGKVLIVGAGGLGALFSGGRCWHTRHYRW